MAEQLRFDGRVVVITGAGNGLGRQHALMFGARGASVVVNDLGGGIHGGDGKSSTAADKVVEEIKALGGKAVANYDSVENGAGIIKTALDAFGTVDILVNNAGILRDVSFQKMTQQDWDLVRKVHLDGAFSVTHAAWPIMRDKGYGRVIFTTSGAGIYGNFGQANYSAAKLGLYGLANSLTQEGRGKGILVNTIAPIAASRLTETVMPPDLLAVLKPEYISPLVGYLCHESCEETGGLFEIGAGYISKLRWERTLGHTFSKARPWDVEQVAAKWDKIVSFENAEHPTSVNDTVGAIMKALNSTSLGGNEFIDLDVASAAEKTLESSYSEKDLALYALGVGAARDPLDTSDLKYVYELNDQFTALPTWAVMPPSNAMLALAKDGGTLLPGLNYGFDRLLHGEQYTEVYRPLPKNGKFTHTFKMKAAYDKAPHAVVIIGVTTRDENGEEIAYNESASFVRGAGGWGGERGPGGDANVPPQRQPDLVIEERTMPNQTLFYRLCGDWNPLHADPEFAKAFGYDRPILHGLCTYGIVGRQIVKAYCGNDARKFKSIKVRFAETVFPGETLVTRLWKESDLRIVFDVRVKERDKLVIKNAAVELFDQIPLAKAKPAKAATAAPAASQEFVSADYFNGLARYVEQNPQLAGTVKTSFQFKLTNPDSQWGLDLKSGSGSCIPGELDKPDVGLQATDEDMIALLSGKGDAQKLYFGGKLKVTGNVMASNKLAILQKIDPKLFEEARAARLGGKAPAQPAAMAAAAAPAAPKSGRSVEVFAALSRKLGGDPKALNGLSGSVLQFNVREPDASWTVDLSGKAAKVEAGASAKAQAVFGIADEDLLALAKGEADLRDLFQRGRLRVDGGEGAVKLARGLTALSKLI